MPPSAICSVEGGARVGEGRSSVITTERIIVTVGAVVAVQTVIVFLAEALIGDELKPVHCCDEVKSFK